jgi:hypothetical protein
MKVYLDTSVLPALFDARNPERQELTKEFFSRIDEHEVFISELTRVEGEYINQGAVSEKYPEDAYHIAVAVVNDLDIVLSWNFAPHCP